MDACLPLKQRCSSSTSGWTPWQRNGQSTDHLAALAAHEARLVACEEALAECNRRLQMTETSASEAEVRIAEAEATEAIAEAMEAIAEAETVAEPEPLEEDILPVEEIPAEEPESGGAAPEKPRSNWLEKFLVLR